MNVVYFYTFLLEFLVLFVKYATAKICITQETRVPQQFVHPTFGIRYPGFQYPGIRYPVSEFSASGYPVSGIRVSGIRYPLFLSVGIRYPTSGIRLF